MRDVVRYAGRTEEELCALLGVPHVELLARTTSALDVAHQLGADGAPSGALVLAHEQTAGRGRAGKAWASAAGQGIWLALLERTSADAIEVLALRLGIRAADALDPYVPAPVQLKWPNDLYTDGRKLGGILVEVRWRLDRLDSVAIGVGVNTRRPDSVPRAGALAADSDPIRVLAALVPALRAAAASRGPLTSAELEAWRARDLAVGRRCRAPAVGVVRGIDARGSLCVATVDGETVACRAGSLVLEEDE